MNPDNAISAISDQDDLDQVAASPGAEAQIDEVVAEVESGASVLVDEEDPNPTSVPESAAACLLLQARSFTAGYGYGFKAVDVRLASIGLCQALVRGDQLDLKAPVSDDPVRPALPLPASWATIENPYEDRVSAWADLDPHCLAVETDEGPSFKTAVIATLARIGKGLGGRGYSVDAEDAALAEWTRHIPARHCQAFDEPGDMPAAGLLNLLRASAHYEQLEAELGKKGFDLDGRLADGTPTSIKIHSSEQWDTWLAAGGEPTVIVPAAGSRPAMTVWEFQGLYRPAELLPSIRTWAESVANPPAGFMDRLEHLEFWHRVDVLARSSSSRDAFVASLREELPDWAKRTDDWGRNVLQRTIGQQQAFLTTCVRSARLKGQITHTDHARRGIWHYALPALLSYNRSSDAKTLASELALQAKATRQSLDGDRQRGLLLDAIIEAARAPAPDPKAKPESQRNRPSRDYASLGLPLDALVGGNDADQDEAATYLLSLIDPNTHNVDGLARETIVQIAKTIDAKGVSLAVDLTPAMRGVMAYLMLCPTTNAYGSLAREASLTEKAYPFVDAWIEGGAQLPPTPNQPDPYARFQSLVSLWGRNGPSLATGSAGLRPRIAELFTKWRTFEEAAHLDRSTADAPIQPSRTGIRL